MKIEGIGNILFVKDFEKMSLFYEDVLNLTPSTSQGGWRKYVVGNSAFALHEIPAAIAGAIKISDPPKARSETPFKPVFRVENVDDVRNELLVAGVRRSRVSKEPRA